MRQPGGRITTIDLPARFDGTAVTDINNRGQLLGVTAIDFATPTFQGFLLARGVKGPFTPIRFPGAPSTLVSGLNDRGQITGTYNNPNLPPDPQRSAIPPMGRMA